MPYDVIIIGAGVSGAMIAHSLAKYNLKVCVLEKESDVSMGTTAANSAIIHAGFDPEPGSLKAKLNREGSLMMERTAKELSVPYKRIGAMVLCFDEERMPDLRLLYERGLSNKIDELSIISGKEVLDLEPNISSNVKAALYAKTSAIISPFELTVAACENAADHGTEFVLEAKVENIEYSGETFKVSTTNGTFESRFLVNAAGVFADEIAKMVGDDSYEIVPRKGEYLLMDKAQGNTVRHTIFQLPTELGKGILITPTVDNNLLIGPTAEDVQDKNLTETTSEGLKKIMDDCRRILPNMNFRDVITSFTGLRATLKPKGDFIIAPSKKNSKFINVGGIESPGLSAAPAIGEYAVELLKKAGLKLEENKNYNPCRKPVKRFCEMTEEEITKAHEENPLYARIICRCEKVTEAEIVDAIKRNVGATTLDGVKRRTRAGMGRCQGGFCGPSVVDILARELGIPKEQVTKKGTGSWLLTGRTK